MHYRRSCPTTRCRGSTAHAPRETGPARLRFRTRVPPGDQSSQIDRQNSKDMLQTRLCHPAVTRIAQLEGLHALVDRAFYAGPHPIALLELVRLLVLARPLQRRILWLRPQLERAWATLGFGTRLPHRTRPTGCPLELDVDDRLAGCIGAGRPDPAGLTLRADHLLGVPIHCETGTR